MTTAVFRYLDPATISRDAAPFVRPWAKVDSDVTSYARKTVPASVHNIRASPEDFGVDVSGFAVYNFPAAEKDFTDDAAVRGGYYAEVENLLKSKLPGVSKVVIFDHTIRRRDPAAPRQPVQGVHVDQTPSAAAARVRRHLPADEAEALLQKRFQLINVWRPIGHPATDFPLAVVDWRTTSPEDLVSVDLLYPKRAPEQGDDDRGLEALPDPSSATSTEGYEIKGMSLARLFSPSFPLPGCYLLVLVIGRQVGLTSTRRDIRHRTKRQAQVLLRQGHDPGRGHVYQVLRLAQPGPAGRPRRHRGSDAAHGLPGPGHAGRCQGPAEHRGPLPCLL